MTDTDFQAVRDGNSRWASEPTTSISPSQTSTNLGLYDTQRLLPNNPEGITIRTISLHIHAESHEFAAHLSPISPIPLRSSHLLATSILRLGTETPQKWLAVPLVATATARTSPTPRAGPFELIWNAIL